MRKSMINMVKLFLLVLFLGANTVHAQISTGAGHFEFSDQSHLNGESMRVFYYLPQGDVTDMPILFVMHGTLRNADDYRDNWKELADKHQVLILVPEFSKVHFPGSRTYNYGNLFSKDGIVNPSSEHSYGLIDPIFDSAVKQTNSNAKHYDLFGHSAGSQFAHRFLLFTEKSKVNRVVAANAGSYSALDFETPFPFGLKNTNIDTAFLGKMLSKNLVIQLGEQDTDPQHQHLNRSELGMKQGAKRFERGIFFYRTAKAFSEQEGFEFNWVIRTVPNVAHENAKMAIDAADYLYR